MISQLFILANSIPQEWNVNVADQDFREFRKQYNSDTKEQFERLTRIETVLIPNPGQPSTLEQLELRITALEIVRWKMVGMYSAISALFIAIYHIFFKGK